MLEFPFSSRGSVPTKFALNLSLSSNVVLNSLPLGGINEVIQNLSEIPSHPFVRFLKIFLLVYHHNLPQSAHHLRLPKVPHEGYKNLIYQEFAF